MDIIEGILDIAQARAEKSKHCHGRNAGPEADGHGGELRSMTPMVGSARKARCDRGLHTC